MRLLCNNPEKKWGGVLALSLLLCGSLFVVFPALSFSVSKDQLKGIMDARKNPQHPLNKGCVKLCPYFKHRFRSFQDWEKWVMACFNKHRCYLAYPNSPCTAASHSVAFCIGNKWRRYKYHERKRKIKPYAGPYHSHIMGSCTPHSPARVYGGGSKAPLPSVCEPTCTKKPCECGPDICENETCPDKVSCPCGDAACPGECPAKVDCPGGGIACTLAECPGKTSPPGFNIGNLILGNLPQTANKSLPPNTNVPLNQAGAVVQGALRVYVESFDDFKVCDKKGQCYKVCYSDGTNCPPRKKK